MTGPLETKKLLRGAKVYIHFKDDYARIEHIDIEGDIDKIIKEGETSFIKGKKGGVFIALKKPMIKRIKSLYKK
ncbi:hypothetical protein ACFL1H_08160 [Nanoarchaeota archaeon]